MNEESFCKACKNTGKITRYLLSGYDHPPRRVLVDCPVCTPPPIPFTMPPPKGPFLS